jgi:ATP-dependent DNA helicase RecQ
VLRLTEASRAVLKGERAIEVRRPAEKPAGARKSSRKDKGTRRRGESVALGSADEALFERLRGWRADIAKEHGVPPYVVFHDTTLRAIAQARPASLDALRAISGVGERKLENYGAAIVRIVGGGD